MINSDFWYNLGKKTIIVLIIILIVMVGYYKVFYGSNFFVDEDCIGQYKHTERNAKGNGWRPDVAFGMSFFHGNPGSLHPWSLWSLWPKLFETEYLSYTSSVIILIILACLSVYTFLLRISPTPHKSIIILAILAPLISFSPLQHEFYFQRHWITLAIGTPQILILLNSYFKESRVAYLFQAAFIFWFVWFLGSFIAVYELLVVSILFSILYYSYHRTPIKDIFLKFTFMHLAVLFSVILLGAWIYYSMFIEYQTVNYIRDSIYKTPSNTLFLGFKKLWLNVLQKLHAGWLPNDIVFLNLTKILDKFGLRTFSWDNCFVSFPIIFLLFMPKKPFSFWEYILFWFIIIFYLHDLLMQISPLYYNMMCKNIFEYPLQKFQPAYHCFQIGMLAFFLSRYDSYLSYKKHWASYIRRILAFVLSFAYFVLILFAVAIWFFPSTMNRFFTDVDLLQLRKSITFSIIAFYLSSAFITGIFSNDKWIRSLLNNYPNLIAILFLMNGIFLSWGIYPMNDKPLIWDIRKKEIGNLLSQTSRFFWSQPLGQNCIYHDNNFRWGINEAEAVRQGVGYRNIPGFNVNETKPFTQREVRDFILNSLTWTVVNQPPLSVRDISGGHYYREHNAIAFDMASISHVFTIGQCDVPDRLKLLDKIVLRYAYYNTNLSDLCVYKNKTAWPYFYLAEMDKVGRGMDLFKPKQQDTSFVRLREFSYGKMNFNYKGTSENILVVSDAWHPFWKAYIDNVETPVFKANGIFKGVKLPGGEHSVVMVFDTSPYRPGIYVSIVAWISFFFFWLYFFLHKTVLKFNYKKNTK